MIKAIKEHEAGAKIDDICRNLGISSSTFYNWFSNFAGTEVNEAKQFRELEAENNEFKKLLTVLYVIYYLLHLQNKQHKFFKISSGLCY